MQKQFLVLGTLFSVATATHAQQINPYQQAPVQIIPAPNQPRMLFLKPTPVPPPISAAKGLAAVAGKTDVFTLAPGTYDSKELLELLAVKSGGKAIFVDEWKTQPLPLRTSLQGTAAELIEKLRDYGVVAGKLGADWVFLSGDKIPTRSGLPPLFRSDNQTPNLRYYLRPDRGVPVLPGREVPVLPTPKNDPDFNIKPNPGQNLSPQATPFSFNGSRLYRVPLQPTP